MRKPVLTILLALVLSNVGAQEKRYNIPLGDSPSMGPDNAPVTIIEFIDFQ